MAIHIPPSSRRPVRRCVGSSQRPSQPCCNDAATGRIKVLGEVATGSRRGSMRARYPDGDGYVERDGVKVAYEVFGDGHEPTILLLPTWSIIHSLVWKMQVPYLARHHRVIT